MLVTKYNFVMKKTEEVVPFVTSPIARTWVDCLDKVCVFCGFRRGFRVFL